MALAQNVNNIEMSFDEQEVEWINDERMKNGERGFDGLFEKGYWEVAGDCE